MSQKPETIFKDRVRDALKTLPMTWFVKIQQMTIRGTPDFLLCIQGHFVAIELKKDDKEKADPLQEFTLEKITRCGGTSFVANPQNWEEIFKTIQFLAMTNPQQH